MAEKKGSTGTRRGRVGADIFQQVERLIAQEKLGRTAALRKVAEQIGKQFGTVAANYYRVARKSGTKLRKRRRVARKAATTPRRRAGRTSSDLGRVLAALRDVGELLRKQDAEITRLRKENTRFAAIRRLISRG